MSKYVREVARPDIVTNEIRGMRERERGARENVGVHSKALEDATLAIEKW